MKGEDEDGGGIFLLKQTVSWIVQVQYISYFHVLLNYMDYN